MLYTIDLQGMEFHAFHGCYDLEQRVGNRFEVTLSITTELGGIAAHDAVEEAVNYLTVYEIVRERMAVTQRTIERVATNIIEALHARFPALPNKPTVFIVSQRTSSLRHADKILVLDNGALVGCGTHDALLENCSVYREIYDSQFGGKEAAAK